MLNHILRRRPGRGKLIEWPPRIESPEVRRQKAAEFGPWMYRLDLGDGVDTPVHDEYLEANHQTRWSMMEPELERTVAGRAGRLRALDMACNEGWFSFQTARLGVPEVIGFDAREGNLRKAAFAAAHSGLTGIEFRWDNLFDVTAEGYGTFDIVLCLGLLYHLENPMGALRRVRQLTRELCVIETEVARDASVTVDRGPVDGLITTPDFLAVVAEPYFEWHPLASVTGISMVPSLSGLKTLLKHAGFRDITQAQPTPGAAGRYTDFDRVVIFARA